MALLNIRVPRIVDADDNFDDLLIAYGAEGVSQTAAPLTLRPYQIEDLDAVKAAYAKGVRRMLIANPTGTGKTVVFSRLPIWMRDTLPGKTLVVVHREELIQQNAEELRIANPTLRVDIEKAEQYADLSADIVVASVATLGRENSKRRQRFDWSLFDICIVDEAHHSVATTYKNILRDGGFLENGSRKLLVGVTATPNRSDGTPLAEVYEEIVADYPIRKAIEDGYLCDLKGVRVETESNLDDVHTLAGDFNQGELARAIDNPERNLLVAKAWLDHASGRKTIIFAVSVDHAKFLAELLQKKGVEAQSVWGTDPNRAEKIRDFKDGKINVLVNCAVLTEGFNDPNVSCVLLATPTKSTLRYTQMIGRGTRTAEDKADCLIIDVVDASSRHTLETLPSLFGLPKNFDLDGDSVLGSLKAVEDARKKYRNAMVELKRLKDLAIFSEKFSFFSSPVPAEVAPFCRMKWMADGNDGFLLLLNRQAVSVSKNALNQWLLSGVVDGQVINETHNDPKSAVKSGEDFILTRTKSAPLVLRNVKWHGDPATEKQLWRVKQECGRRGIPVPQRLTKGEASDFLNKIFGVAA
jgi:superfamily II DNA or RNA helicase